MTVLLANGNNEIIQNSPNNPETENNEVGNGIIADVLKAGKTAHVPDSQDDTESIKGSIAALYEEGSGTVYKIIAGNDSSWTQGSGTGLTITGNGDFSMFEGVKVDDTLLDESDYQAESGSTIVTVNASYLEKLSVGTHTIEMMWRDDSVETTFTINAESPKDDNNTGDEEDAAVSEDVPAAEDDIQKAGNTDILAVLAVLVVVILLCGVGLAYITVRKNHRKNRTGE